ncbi:MAG: SAM-dependent methyltransferase [Anaerolineae bacterium]|nr:MAG: SAM-dependent methyltransferase [Anaerolineae bacterium]
MQITKPCPSCYSNDVFIFHEALNTPVNSVLLLNSRKEALNFTRGDVILGFCRSCGFIYNLVFEPHLLEYSNRYESTQGYSQTFNNFQIILAEQLIEKYNLHNKNIVEIGCGQGEFLSLLCDNGKNRGLGFDPVYDSDRNNREHNKQITFIGDFYSEKYSYIDADFVCCKMTLEHIQNTGSFIGMLGRILSGKPQTVVFFQVPDIDRILQEIAFWDIYYEHCSYFSLGSLARLFRRCNFDVVALEKAYSDQYLMITVRPGIGLNPALDGEEDLSNLTASVENFSRGYKLKLEEWQRNLEAMEQAGKRIVIWGASSKAVAFLTALREKNGIDYVVDINPRKKNTYIAGTGQKVVGPEFLVGYKPDIAIVMNPIYIEEIQDILGRMMVSVDLLTL